MSLAYVSVRKRCADTILLAHKIFHGHSWPLSREELAQWSGTAKETFTRNLTDFKDLGYIEIDGSLITVINHKALAEVPY